MRVSARGSGEGERDGDGEGAGGGGGDGDGGDGGGGGTGCRVRKVSAPKINPEEGDSPAKPAAKGGAGFPGGEKRD